MFRFYDASGLFSHDVLALESAIGYSGEALLQPVMRGGKRLHQAATVTESRTYCAAQMSLLPTELRKLNDATPYSVHIADDVKALANHVDVIFG
ncbi:MAG: hypothetical protein QM709_12420 [Spongiibacteraceae bacterium]